MTSRTADSAYSSSITCTSCDDTASGTPSYLWGRVATGISNGEERLEKRTGETMESENNKCCLDNYEKPEEKREKEYI